MKKKELEKFNLMLEKQKKDITELIIKMKTNGVSKQSEYYPTELSNYDNHPAEIATEMFDVEFNNALLVHEEHLFRDISHALEKFKDNTYGNCELCDKQIKRERLEAIPYTRVCMACEEKKAVKPTFTRRNRPVEELVIDAPIGRKYLNEREDDEYEGLDQLNDLVKYGSSDTPQDMGGYYNYEEYYSNEIDKQGIVDKMDQISNQSYISQLPD